MSACHQTRFTGDFSRDFARDDGGNDGRAGADAGGVGPTVRGSLPTDRDAILALVEAAFTGVDHDGGEEVRIVLDTWRSGAVVEDLELVAVEDDGVVGYVLGARGRAGSPALAGVAPLCVTPARQDRGIGTALMTELLGRAERLRWPGVVLLGDPGYYGRFGFEAAGTLEVVYEAVGAHDPHFQIKRLSGWDDSIRGSFVYCWES